MAGTYGTPNRQPIFTQAPIMVSTTFDPPVMVENYLMYNQTWGTPPENVYTCVSQEGDLIDRIRISATGDVSNDTVNAKLVYVYIYDSSTDKYSLYKTLAMPAAIIDHTTPNPELELTFTGGLVLNLDDEIRIAASTNQVTTGRGADQLSVTIEGGRYTLNP